MQIEIVEEPSTKLIPLEGTQDLVTRIEGFLGEMVEAAKRSEFLIKTAEEFQVTTAAEMQFADDMRLELEAQAKVLEARRLNLTRPLDDLKAYVMDQVRPAIDNNQKAASVYRSKVLAYRAAEQYKADAARLEAERIQRETQARLEAEAKKKEEAAAKLKTEAARRRKLDEAESLRLAAQNTPTSLVAAPAPALATSSIVNKWYWKINDWPKFLGWLVEHPEWLNEQGSNSIVVGPKVAAMNKLAGQFGKAEVPGVEIWSEEDLRKKGR